MRERTSAALAVATVLLAGVLGGCDGSTPPATYRPGYTPHDLGPSLSECQSYWDGDYQDAPRSLRYLMWEECQRWER